MKKIYAQFKLHLACSNDPLQSLHYVYCKNGIAYATDAVIAVRADLTSISNLTSDDIAKLDDYLIKKDIWEDLLQSEIVDIKDNTLVYRKNTEEKTAEMIKNNTTFKYPDIEAVFNRKFDKKSTEYIAFDIDKLKNLSGAMGNLNELKLSFNGPKNHICVTYCGSASFNIKGIIMPILFGDDE